MTPQPPDGTTRTFARVDVALPVRVRPIDEDEAQRLAQSLGLEPSYRERLSADAAGRAGGERSWERLALLTLLERLERLERGVEAIANALEVSLEDGGGWLEGETVSISGSGLGLRLPRRLDEDGLVEAEVTLLGETTGVVRLVGRVTTLVKPDGETLPVGRFHLGLSFEAIHDEDREAIVHYTFRLQRAQIREMRSQDED